MIKLSSRHTMVVDGEGALRSLDLDGVCADLYRCFRRCGIAEPWAADHIAMVVEEQLALRNSENSEPLAVADVHGMVSALLGASGYDDVRREYRQSNPTLEPSPNQDELLPWDAQRIRAEIGHCLPMAREQTARLEAQTMDALGSLGLQQVSSEFIGQLAVHILRRDATVSATAGADEPGMPWLVAPGQWPVLFDAGVTRDLMGEGVLKLYPVSRFLPRVRLRMDLAPLGRALPVPMLAAITLLPRIHRAVLASMGFLEAAWAHVDALLGAAEAPAPRLIVTHLDALVEGVSSPPSPQQAKELRDEVRHLILSHVAAWHDGRILVTFR